MSEESRLPDELDEMHLLFHSRGQWHGLSPQTEEESTNQFLIELLTLRRESALNVQYLSIPRVAFSAAMPTSVGGYEWRMRSIAYRRPGHEDLAEHMWSAYAYLQGRFPGEALKVTTDAPHLYLASSGSVAVTAGDLAVERVLREVVYRPLETLGIVAAPGVWRTAKEGDANPKCDLALLTFSPEAIFALRTVFEERRQRFIEKLEVSRAQMSNRNAPTDASEYVQELLKSMASKGDKKANP